jgi:hypothetical protein
MNQSMMGRWGFTIGGVLFLIAAIMPWMGGQKVSVSFFVLGIAFLIIGAAARQKHAAGPPKD